MTKHTCQIGYCAELGAIEAQDQAGERFLLCQDHAEGLMDLGLVELVELPDDLLDEVKAGLEDLAELDATTCDAEDCTDEATVWVLWKVDEDDDDEVVGYLCESHAASALERGHATRLTAAEALARLMADADAEDWADLCDALNDWIEALYADMDD